MDSIKLTEEHKSKLLKMCKKLFPEYLLIDIHKNGLLVLWEELPPSRKWFEIHWFEFCMTHLAEKVLNPKKPARNQKEIFCNFFWETNINWYYQQNGSLPVISFETGAKHPIDYLYEEFKKLK